MTEILDGKLNVPMLESLRQTALGAQRLYEIAAGAQIFLHRKRSKGGEHEVEFLLDRLAAWDCHMLEASRLDLTATASELQAQIVAAMESWR